jgi:hypothetical protein
MAPNIISPSGIDYKEYLLSGKKPFSPKNRTVHEVNPK